MMFDYDFGAHLNDPRSFPIFAVCSQLFFPQFSRLSIERPVSSYKKAHSEHSNCEYIPESVFFHENKTNWVFLNHDKV